MNLFDNVHHNPIIDHYQTNQGDLEVVIDMDANAMHRTDALLTAVQHGWMDLAVLLFPRLPKSVSFDAALQTALLHNQDAMIDHLLPQLGKDQWKEHHTLAAFSLVRNKNAAMFKRVLKRIPTTHVCDHLSGSLNMFEWCVRSNWIQGMEILLEEYDRRAYEDEGNLIEFRQSDDFGLKEAYERADYEMLKLLAPRVQIDDSLAREIVRSTPPNHTVAVLQIFDLKPSLWREVLSEALAEEQVLNWDVVKEALRHTSPAATTLGDFLDRVCRNGDLDTYCLFEEAFRQVTLNPEHLRLCARSGAKELMVKLLSHYPKDLPSDIAEQAARSGSLEMMTLFANSKNLPDKDPDILTAAIEGGNVDVLKLVLPFANPYRNNSRALFQAVQDNKSEMVDILLPLSNPAAQQGEILEACVMNNNLPMFEQLLPYCHPQDDDSSAFRTAARNGKMEFVTRLLPLSDLSAHSYGAIADAADNEHIEVVRFLLRQPEIQDNVEQVRDSVYNRVSTEGYQLINDILAEMERETIHGSMQHTPETTVKRRRL